MTTSALVIIVVLAALFVVVMPLAVITSLNTLFGLGIAYTWKTWLAALILTTVVYGSSNGSKKS